jgi:hypothetical protein
MVIMKSNESSSRVRPLILVSLLGVGLGLLLPSGAQAQSGPPTNNLQLWLKADAGVTTSGSNVTAWADQSGNGNNATLPATANPPVFVASDPALNGKPVLQFNVTDFLQLTNALDMPGDVSGFVIMRLHSSSIGNYRGIIDQECGAGYPDPNQWMIYADGTSVLQRGDGCGMTYSFNPSSFAVSNSEYLELAFVAAGTNVNMYLDNCSFGQDVATAPITAEGILMRIGARYPSGSSLDADVAELLLYNAGLSDTDRTNVWTYLATKYDLFHTVTCTMTSPANGSTAAAPATIAATATASVSGGSVVNVSFVANGLTLGTITVPPYAIALNVLNPGSLTLQAVVMDNLGLTTTSAPVTVTYTGTTPTFSGNSNLVLWLEADAGVSTDGSGNVTNWADQSSSGNNASSGAFGPPAITNGAINGLPAVAFNATNLCSLAVPYSSMLSTTNDIASIVVLNPAPDNAGNYIAVWWQGVGVPAPNAFFLFPGIDPSPGWGDGTAQTFVNAPTGLPPSQWSIMGFSKAGQTVSQFLDAIPNGGPTPGSASIADGLSPTYIGTRGDYFSFFDGEIAELMIFNTSLTGTTLNNLQAYLGTKYGMALVVPAPDLGPVVSILSPANGGSVAAPGNFAVTATATPVPATSIATVQLYVNGIAFSALSAPPYQWPVYVSTPGPVTLMVTATDNHGVANSASATITATGSTNATYTAGMNVVLWLRADVGVSTDGGGNVTEWADQSSYGNNLFAGTGTPTNIPNAVNGLPALYFDTSIASYLVANDSPSLAITNDIASFAVLNPNANSPGNYREIWWQGNGIPEPNAFFIFPGNDPAPGWGDGSGVQDFFPAPITLPGLQWSIVGFSKQGQTMSQYFNGVPNGAPQLGSGAAVDAGLPLYVGTRGDFYSYLRADLAEVMIFNTALTGTNLDNVRQYLGVKYGLALVAPGQPPPTLSIARQGNAVVISWPLSVSGYVLQSASSLSGSWAPVAGVQNNQVTVTPPLPTQQFYQLVLP